ncbi:MAG: response regulator transcription factor [Planctomycetes bacterium]|nr:response regulator transcription factor [Planctomycetota bacterium]
MSDDVSILVVEDEPGIRLGLCDFLSFHNFKVTEAVDGNEARQCVERQGFDLILLDLMLPVISGDQLCRQWRQQGITTPIIMVTAKGLQQDKVSGLNLGADDYITKPFSLDELLARIQAVLRRTRPERSVGQTFEFGPWEVDVAELKIKSDSSTVEISQREGQLLQFFAAQPNQVISRDELYKNVWGETISELGTRTVDMHIAKLRGKIEPNSSDPQIIKTIRGAGYKFENEQVDVKK